MRIALASRTFPPLIGGLENVAEMTAHALGELGHEVVVVTNQPGAATAGRAYTLVHRPPLAVAVRCYRRADYVVMMNVSLRMMLPVLLSFRPLIVWHHGLWHGTGESGRMSLASTVKSLVVRFLAVKNLACSQYIADRLPLTRGRGVLPNPYDARVFKCAPGCAPQFELLFVGRLVSDKGADCLVSALAGVRTGPLSHANLSIVGVGPEETRLRELVRRCDLEGRVRFLGPKRGVELRDVMAAHRVLVVPSVWDEPFGIVALEGLAAGCQVVVFRSGGLPEAVGGCGEIIEKGDLEGLRACVARLLSSPSASSATSSEMVARHLASHTPRATALRLVQELRSVQGRGCVRAGLRRILKPWLVFQPLRLARRLVARNLDARSDFIPLRTSWGARLLVNPATTIGRSILYTGLYELAVSEALVRLIRPGDTVVDAGANIGYMTVLAALAAGPTGRVISFEPHPDLFCILSENVATARHSLKVADAELHRTALGEVAGCADLLLPDGFDSNDGLATLVRCEEIRQEAARVSVETLDDALGCIDVAVLKLDVEGFEAKVLRGFARGLAERRVKHVVFEEHACESGAAEILQAAGYTVFALGWSMRGLVIQPYEVGSSARNYEAPNFIATVDPADVVAEFRRKGWRVMRNLSGREGR